jgi:hypothetical protein
VKQTNAQIPAVIDSQHKQEETDTLREHHLVAADLDVDCSLL